MNMNKAIETFPILFTNINDALERILCRIDNIYSLQFSTFLRRKNKTVKDYEVLLSTIADNIVDNQPAMKEMLGNDYRFFVRVIEAAEITKVEEEEDDSIQVATNYLSNKTTTMLSATEAKKLVQSATVDMSTELVPLSYVVDVAARHGRSKVEYKLKDKSLMQKLIDTLTHNYGYTVSRIFPDTLEVNW